MVAEAPDGKARSRAPASITVRLAPQPATETVSPAVPEPEIPAAEPRMRLPEPILDREPRAAVAAAREHPARDAPPLPLPQVPDSTYYAARDLDVYPRPVAPLELDRVAAGDAAPGRVTLALLIDEHGVVNEVALAGPAAPGRVEEGLRAVVAATRFFPARKDGRAVKSRVVLSVDFGQEKREP